MSVAGAQLPPDWVQLTPATTPTNLTGHTMVSEGGSILMFGGNSAGAYVDETWRFDGTDWTQLTPSLRPPARRRHGGAYDTARGRLVVFGGEANGGAALSDTWEFDGTTWTQIMPATVPPARRDHAMTYDPGNGITLMFSGRDMAGTLLADVWAWDGVNWTQFLPATLPPARWDGQMTWDGANANIVLYGGNGGGGLSDTWIWTAGTWTQVIPPQSPGPLYTHSMTYDAIRGRVVAFGGYDGGRYVRDVWEWDGVTWTQRPAAPVAPQRGGPQIVFDPVLGRTYLYGGWFGAMNNDTWELRPNRSWQENQVGASLDLNGNPSGAFFGPSRLEIPLGGAGVANLASALGGSPWDIALGASPARPRGLGGFPLGSQLVNLDLATLTFTQGGAFTTPWGGVPLAVPFTGAAPLVASAQMVVVDPSQAIGFTLSAPAELTVADCTYLENMDAITIGAGALPAGWSTPAGVIPWILWQRSTPTSNTGPAADHTTGAGKYLYCETSAPWTTATFTVELAPQPISNLASPTLDFWLHMHGGNVGTLSVQEFDGVSWVTLQALSGDQGMPWQNLRVPLSPTPSGIATLRMVYTAAGGNGDIAIDDVAICN